MNLKYELDFILHARNSSPQIIRNALAEFASRLSVSALAHPGENDYQVNLVTEDPTLVFDLCSQLGRIRSIKVHENHKP